MVSIKSAKLLKKGDTLEVQFAEPKPGFKTPPPLSGEFKEPVHQDLRDAFAGLAVHYGLLTYQIDRKKYKKIDAIPQEIKDEFYASSFSLSTRADVQIITISGHRILPNKKAWNGTAPPQEMEEPAETNAETYPFIEELVDALERVNFEIDQYIVHGKRVEMKPDAQATLFPGEVVTHAQILAPEGTTFLGQVVDPAKMREAVNKIAEEKRGRGRPKKVAQTSETPSGQIEDMEPANDLELPSGAGEIEPPAGAEIENPGEREEFNT